MGQTLIITPCPPPSLGPVQTEGRRHENRHLATRDIALGAEIATTATACDSGVGERLDEPEGPIVGRHIAKGRRRGCRRDRASVDI